MQVLIEVVVFRDGLQERGELGYLLGGERTEELGLMFVGELLELAEGRVAGGR